MKNPWLNIPYSDYENHMSDIGQLQLLSKLTKYCLEKYKPQTFAMLGCAGGNGLEHIDCSSDIAVYAIDINPDYLEIAQSRFGNCIKCLHTINIDIERDELAINNIDLFFLGLILEYVAPYKTLSKVINTLKQNGTIAIIIQENKQTTFVSSTRYKSLEQLSDIAKDVDEQEINRYLHTHNFEQVNRQVLELTENKSFILLEYTRKSSD